MKNKKAVIAITAIFVVGLLLFAITYSQKDKPANEIQVSAGDVTLTATIAEATEVQDISQSVSSYEVSGDEEGTAEVYLTTREFPNGDRMVYIEAESHGYVQPIHVMLPFDGGADTQYTKDAAVSSMYTYRKARSLEDPLSTTLHYVENPGNSALLGTAVYFNDISETYANGEESKVMEFQREAKGVSLAEEGLELVVEFAPQETHFSTWLMLSKEKLVTSEQDFAEIHKIGADEFRWITPDTLWSHGLSTIFPASEDAFVRSLVRQSGRASAVQLETDPSRFWENINRHHFASLEAARHEDGLWHSNYTSTWLEGKYGIKADYIDSRHNDNIFRSQLARAESLGYDSYADERAVYADFLIEMAEAGFKIPEGDGYHLIDYYDMNVKTHASLNHALSLMNYQYDAYRYLEDEKYLKSAEQQFEALQNNAEKWIDEEGIVIYQMNLDGTMSGKDYNLVTYYDLLYTKKLRKELGLPASEAIERLIRTKQQNLIENSISIEGDIENVEQFIGLIE